MINRRLKYRVILSASMYTEYTDYKKSDIFDLYCAVFGLKLR